jgi:hypothetical protein
MSLDQLAQFASVLGVVLPLSALAWSAVVYVGVKREETRHKEFQKFFEVMDYFGKPGSSVASKMAAAYELRRFPEYKDVIVRLAEKAAFEGSTAGMLKEELDLTASFLKSRSSK